MSKADDDFIALARARFDQAQSANEKQRQRELDDLRFYAGDQWDALQKTAREGQPAGQGINGLPPVPARPTFVINKVREPVRQVLNDEEQAEFSIELVAADDFGGLTEPNPANEAEIDLREGLVRRIQRTSEAEDARTWAASRAAIAGVGWYRVMTRYLPGKTNDKEVYIERIFNQSSVSADPAHEQPDGSDCEWIFDGVDMSIDRYRAEFGHLKGNRVIGAASSDSSWQSFVAADDAQWRSDGDEAPEWFSGDGLTKSVRVMNYWYTERTMRTLCMLADGTSEWKDELPPGAAVIDSRPVADKIIKWAKIDGIQVLEETDWEGPDMPYVKILGEELHPYDNERRCEGMVRPARDANKGFNAMASKLTEVVGLAPIPPLLVAEGTVDAYKEWYLVANTRTLPYLPYKQTDLQGNPAPPPSSTPRDVPIAPIATALQMFDEAVRSTTGVPDSALGHQDPSVKSGKMAQALIQQSQHGTSHFLQAMKRSIRYEAQIINNLFYQIYGTRPGRLAHIVDGDGESQPVRIGAPASPPAAMPPQPGAVLGLQAPPPQKNYVLTEHASYNVVANVVKNSGTRREQESAIVGNLLDANPAFITWFGDLFFANQDGPGHKEMADRAKVMLDPKIQAAIAAKNQTGPDAQQLMQKVSQQQQQLDDAHKLLQKASSELESKQMEYASKEKIAAADRDADLEKERMRNATSIAVAKLGILGKGVIAQGEAEDEMIALHTELTHDATQAELDRQHQAQQAAQAQAHQAATGAAQAGTAADQQASQQQHEAEQAQAAAQVAAQQQQEPGA